MLAMSRVGVGGIGVDVGGIGVGVVAGAVRVLGAASNEGVPDVRLGEQPAIVMATETMAKLNCLLTMAKLAAGPA